MNIGPTEIPTTELGTVQSNIENGEFTGYTVTTPGGEVVVPASVEDAADIANSLAIWSMDEQYIEPY